MAVHHCIRQLSYCRRDIRDSAGVWGEVSPMTITHTANIDAISTFEETNVTAYQEVVSQSVLSCGSSMFDVALLG